MIKPVLRSIDIYGPTSFGDFHPLSESFVENLMISVAFESDSYEEDGIVEDFDLFVCSASWVSEALDSFIGREVPNVSTALGSVMPRGWLIIKNWDKAVIESSLSTFVASCARRTRAEVAWALELGLSWHGDRDEHPLTQVIRTRHRDV